MSVATLSRELWYKNINMSTSTKYISDYEVWLKLVNYEIRIYDKEQQNHLILGKLTQNGIERNRDVTEQESETIGLLYTIAERYFAPPKTELNKVTARYVLYGLWLELHDSEVRLYYRTGEEYLVVGKLDDEGEITLDKNFRSFALRGDAGTYFKLYKIAIRYFSLNKQKERKQLREHRIKTRRDSIKRTLIKFSSNKTHT